MDTWQPLIVLFVLKGFEIFKGGSYQNARVNKSPVVLGHELFHAWSFEFTNPSRSKRFGSGLLREKSAVEFENYLRASFGEKELRTHYFLEGSNVKVANSNIDEANNYKLPWAKYLKSWR